MMLCLDTTPPTASACSETRMVDLSANRKPRRGKDATYTTTDDDMVTAGKDANRRSRTRKHVGADQSGCLSRSAIPVEPLYLAG